MKRWKDIRAVECVGAYAVTDKKVDFWESQKNGRPENCVTAWELRRDYGISTQKTTRVVKAGKLSGFMLGTQKEMLIKWFVWRDDLLEKYIKSNALKGVGTGENHQANS